MDQNLNVQAAAFIPRSSAKKATVGLAKRGLGLSEGESNENIEGSSPLLRGTRKHLGFDGSDGGVNGLALGQRGSGYGGLGGPEDAGPGSSLKGGRATKGGDEALNLPDDLTDAFTSDLTIGGEETDQVGKQNNGSLSGEYEEYINQAERAAEGTGSDLGGASDGYSDDYSGAGLNAHPAENQHHHQQYYYGEQQYVDPAAGLGVYPPSPVMLSEAMPAPVPVPLAMPVVEVDDETMQLLQLEFPQYSPQSLAEILEANDYNISVTIDVLTQLELETDYNASVAPQLSQVAPALNDINFPSLK
ncbi:CUE domain-containing protein [Chloropicon primus]|uniref:CUE domain-containing protein n=1 Tax=Chloropicon primus TaxID=1764295 RepID=A0A5B8MPD3_9CHLO|nr:hypothetical protein A3770_08p50560 [Chloropicon primus]UPR01759.1 CUE domain-containing protein [Chloropicon primus]|mmetsp:Transcript_3194/g.8854  ORF Transcript_3194/g.8854 Transcript_3194/m.8854 type:complete len:303 (+) Transcript_3194:302-1210(+)|eukprot:QDZ22538.1 hypothetical protein A3770_08p50560 [Chloropicon primus]